MYLLHLLLISCVINVLSSQCWNRPEIMIVKIAVGKMSRYYQLQTKLYSFQPLTGKGITIETSIDQ